MKTIKDVYPHSPGIAKSRGEEYLFRISEEENARCRDRIINMIKDNYNGSSLASDGAQRLLNEFGAQRLCLVLAGNINSIGDWDVRISRENRSWGQKLIADKFKGNVPYLNIHPGILDTLVTQVRDELKKAEEINLDDFSHAELTVMLQERADGEQRDYVELLKKMPAEEIIERAYEKSVRDDILISLKSDVLTEAQTKALLMLPCPIASCYQAWLDCEADHMAEIHNCVESFADGVAESWGIAGKAEEFEL